MVSKYNIKPDVVKVLQSVTALKRVTSEHPNNWSQMPCAVYSTSSKPKDSDMNLNELRTEWTVTVDLYGNKSLSAVQKEIATAFQAIGFRNTDNKDGNQTDLKRIVMTFRAVVDNASLRVFQ